MLPLGPTPRQQETEDLTRQIAERSSEISEIHRLLRTLQTHDSGSTAFRNVLEARHRTLCEEIEDRYRQLGTQISETAEIDPGDLRSMPPPIPGHDPRPGQTIPAAAPAEPDSSPRPGNGVPSFAGRDEGAGREEIRAQGSERGPSESLAVPGYVVPADALIASRPRAGSARSAVLSAMSAAALTLSLSVIALGLIWSLLAGLIAPSPLATPPELRAQLVPAPNPPSRLIQATLTPSTLPTPSSTLAIQPPLGERPGSATDDTPQADPGDPQPSSEVDAPPEEPLDTAEVERTARPAGIAAAVRLRDEPSLSGGVIRSLPRGTLVSMLGSSAVADGLRWAHVRTSDGRDGWVVATALIPR